MSEIGMAISNPYHGVRKPGHIGQAFNGIQVKLMNDEGYEIKTDNNPGEIYIKGPNLFKTYLNKAEAYHSSFKDGWFMTGDIAALCDGYYKIVGRKSVDIIKSGGYKISALEIEEVARQYKDVSDCAVVGIEDEEWGEIIGIWVESMIEDEDDFKSYLKQNLPDHKLPRIYQLEGKNIPRNSIGKVLKKEVIKSIIKT
jgi:malonyl-CoA/methylmalonyl-CoA synthetase